MCEIIIIALLIISVRFRGWKWNSECLIDFCLWRDTQIEFYFKLLFHLPHPHHTQQIPFSRLTGRPVVRVGSSVAIHFFISLSQTSREMTLNILNTLWLSVMACIPVGRHFFCTARDFNYLISFQFNLYILCIQCMRLNSFGKQQIQFCLSSPSVLVGIQLVMAIHIWYETICDDILAYNKLLIHMYCHIIYSVWFGIDIGRLFISYSWELN